MKKVKITILKTTLDKELAAEYGIDGLTACPMMKAGDVFYADYAKPQGFCDEAWKAIYQYVFALAHGADKEFFAAQTYTGVALDEGGEVVGLYILHPNNVGRCGHICNASYAVSSRCRGRHIGEKLVLDCLAQAKEHGFGVLQFNAVVEGNVHARHLYERLGFTQLGTIPHGFRMKDGSFANICPYYKELA